MLDPFILQEAVQQSQQRTQEAKALTAKIKGINGYLQSLLQKKVRIDIEIRRTKTRLTKLKSKGQTVVKSSVQLESLSGLPAVSALSETVQSTPLSADDAQDLRSALNESESLLLEVEQLPLVEDK